MKFNTNELKLIALITMIIDHIGVYLSDLISPELYSVFRIVGRIAMPIFTFFIVEGFLKTSSLKKYMLRLSILAVVTQLISIILYKIYPLEVGFYAANNFNIVFSFVLLLMFLRCIDGKILKYKKSIGINLFDKLLRLVIVLVIPFIYFYINIDYGLIILALGVVIYSFNKVLEKDNGYKYNFWVFIKILELIAIYACCILNNGIYSIYTFLTLPFIFLYNGKKGENIKINKYFFYVVFAIHTIFLYIIASLLRI